MTTKNTIAAQDLAEACKDAMYANDACSANLGITPTEVRPGYARCTMTVRPEMVNGNSLCHGGMVFLLADTAFAYACNSRNRNTVAAGCNIDYVAPATVGDRLVAIGEERSLKGRTGIYDITVRNQNDKVIAYFRGRSHRIQGELVHEDRN